MTDAIRRFVTPCRHPRLTAMVWWNPTGQRYTARVNNVQVEGVDAPVGR
jgi:hypothetical protein